jgi:hypothetical protein
VAVDQNTDRADKFLSEVANENAKRFQSLREAIEENSKQGGMKRKIHWHLMTRFARKTVQYDWYHRSASRSWGNCNGGIEIGAKCHSWEAYKVTWARRSEEESREQEKKRRREEAISVLVTHTSLSTTLESALRILEEGKKAKEKFGSVFMVAENSEYWPDVVLAKVHS